MYHIPATKMVEQQGHHMTDETPPDDENAVINYFFDDRHDFVDDDDDDGEKVEYNDTNSITIIWHIKDVQRVRRDLTDQQAFQVLQRVEDKHDARHGVNWQII